MLFGEIGIDESERDAMECKIPRGIPGILPLVRHGDDVIVVEMRPILVAAFLAVGGWHWACRITFEPVCHSVVIELLGPKQACITLTHDISGRFGAYSF